MMVKLNRRNIFKLGVAGLVAWGGWAMFKPIHRTRQNMTVRLLEPMKEFFTENQLDPSRYLYDDQTGKPLPSYRSSGFFYEIKKYHTNEFVEYDTTMINDGAIIHLPLARSIVLSREAGFITGFYTYLPVEKLNFEEAMLEANRLADQFKYAGAEQTFFPKEPITPHTIAESGGYDFHSIWKLPLKGIKATSYYECRIEIVSSQRFTGSTLPPMAALVTSNQSKKPIYMLQLNVEVSDEIRRELRELDTARQLHEVGELNKGFPLIKWYDDPDWRPEGWQGKWIK